MVTRSERDIEKMRCEVEVALAGYRGRVISKPSLEDRLLENPSGFILSLGRSYRRHLMTTVMWRMGWDSYSGNKQKATKAYVRK